MRDHVAFTPRNFYEYSTIIALVSLVRIGFSLVDIAVVTPLGASYIAAIGTGGTIYAAMVALSFGIVDIHAAQLARAEGEGRAAAVIASLLSAALLFSLAWTVPILLANAMLPWALTLLRQPPEMNAIIAPYLSVRCWSFPITMVALMAPLALRICGERLASFLCLCLGLAVKAALTWIFIQGRAPTTGGMGIEVALGLTTTAAQIAMAAAGYAWLLRTLRRRAGFAPRPRRDAMAAAFRDLLKSAPGIGAWNLNDYAGSLAVIFLMGWFGVAAIAAVNIAWFVASIFYRLPQALCEAAFVYYGYVAGETAALRRQRIVGILRYSLWPTLVAAVLLWLAAAPTAWLFGAGADSPDLDLIAALIRLHMYFVPAYLAQHLFAQFLAVERQSNPLFVSSAVVTFGFVIPVSWLAATSGDSPYAIALVERCGVALLAAFNLYWTYRPARRLVGAEHA